MNKYEAFFNGKRTTIEASDLWDAQKKAVAYFKPRKSVQYMVSVVLTQRADGSEVIHTADF